MGLVGAIDAGQAPSGDTWLYAVGTLAGAMIGTTVGLRWLSQVATRYGGWWLCQVQFHLSNELSQVTHSPGGPKQNCEPAHTTPLYTATHEVDVDKADVDKISIGYKINLGTSGYQRPGSP